MSCPLYKKLKTNGTTFYAFPGAAEDISAAYQNTNYKMYFSKYTLLNFPNSDAFEFDNLKKSANATSSSDFSESIVESLRNYVANHEVVIRESRLNNTKYYYDTNALETTTEKIFWKWCRKLGIIDFEPAIKGDEYFSNLLEFESRDINDDEYFPEFLWKEREITDFQISSFEESDFGVNKLKVKFTSETNFKVGDSVNLYNIDNIAIIAALPGIDTEEGIILEVIDVDGISITFDVEYTVGEEFTSGSARLVYNRLVKYIGEINGVSNVQEANRSYTEVYAHIPDHTGETPDILFRTMQDDNYKSNLTFPIIPSQYQPEILGAENFNSPIVNTPQNYPGSYFGQFDSLNFTYKTSGGDFIRRSGAYYGVNGDINDFVLDGSDIDGVTMDFDTSHYVKMNIPNKNVTNFDQFNALEINNSAPSDFEFNAILWYYSVEDNNGNVRTNLYGISFIDNPDNDVLEPGKKFPSMKKLVSNGQQDGTSYAFNLNLNFNIINENVAETYNPEAINSLFTMNLFNKAMSRLASTNDSFLNIISEQSYIREEILNIKGLVYTQTELSVINEKIKNLEKLLRLYSTLQIVDSDSIEVGNISGTPPMISFNNIDKNYGRIDNYKTTDLYSIQGIIPVNINVPKRDLLVNLVNDDIVDFVLPDGDKLTIVLDKDLYYKQSVEFILSGDINSSENKKLDIFVVSNIGSTTNETSEVLLVGDIDLPVFYNTNTQLPNSAYTWSDFRFNIDFDGSLGTEIELISKDRLVLSLDANPFIVNNSIKIGDVLCLKNFFIGNTNVFDHSGQYRVSDVNGSRIELDISNNDKFVLEYSNEAFPYVFHDGSNSKLSNMPYLTLNKGKRIKITKINDSNDASDVLLDRYQISINDI